MNWIGRVLYRFVSSILHHLPGWSQQRVRLVLINDAHQVLLVQTWLSKQHWALPGGGIEKGETPEMAAVRELSEETGIFIEESSIGYLTTFRNEQIHADLIVFSAKIARNDLPPLKFRYKLEIIDRSWCDITDLPQAVSMSTKQAIALALETKN